MSTIERYVQFRTTINSNLITIKELLSQAEALHKAVGKLDNNVDAEERKRLNDLIDNQYKTIDLLIIQTDSLFKTFVEFAKATEAIKT